jgi:hypothetical protein
MQVLAPHHSNKELRLVSKIFGIRASDAVTTEPNAAVLLHTAVREKTQLLAMEKLVTHAVWSSLKATMDGAVSSGDASILVIVRSSPSTDIVTSR